MKHVRFRVASVALVGLLASSTLVGVVANGAPAAPTKLVGLFKITPGSNSGANVKGSYFRMVQPGGTVAAGPFVPNPSSAASDKTYTLLKPGADRGLSTVKFQGAPTPAFDGVGNALAKKIIQPTSFVGTNFSVSTTAKDPQTGKAAKLPAITVANGKLKGDLSAFAAWWNQQKFNQGSPKPGGSRPALTAGPTGTYNAKTKQFTLNWSSAIVGGPFNGFTGQ